jgi:phosphoglycerate dehydrogenase-like enzyme
LTCSFFTSALYHALKEKRIFAAALDVFEKEPIDPNDPLIKLDNVVLLPHLGSASLKTREAMGMICANAQKAFWGGKKEIPCLLNAELKKSLTNTPKASL